ncbi:MAG: hypothetical protein F6K34_23880, partial [Okeania sp. SIO4D6]|nr:hypothetical protein [Okeania sp. SIO4D6]
MFQRTQLALQIGAGGAVLTGLGFAGLRSDAALHQIEMLVELGIFVEAIGQNDDRGFG